MSLIKTIDELMAAPIGSSVFKVENNDIREYRICCNYPSQHLKSVLITYGTNDGCSQWIGEMRIKNGNIFTQYKEAVNKLIGQMEHDLQSIKDIYLKD